MTYAAAQASISASSFVFLATSPAAREKARIGASSSGDASSRSRNASAGRRQEGANSTPTIDSRGVDINANQMNNRLPAPVWRGLLNAAVPDELRGCSQIVLSSSSCATPLARPTSARSAHEPHLPASGSINPTAAPAAVPCLASTEGAAIYMASIGLCV
jgi:hypothetical protein